MTPYKYITNTNTAGGAKANEYAHASLSGFKREWKHYHFNKGSGDGQNLNLRFCPSSENIVNTELRATTNREYISSPRATELDTPNDEFLYWLIGFTEGDGSFVKTSRNELNFVIVQGKANVEILYKIKNTLGFGQVLKQNERVYRYIVRRKRELMLIILLFNGNIVLPSRKAQFAIFLQTYNTRPFSSIIPYSNNKNMPSLYNTWFLGFVEAEGCFTISLLSNSNAFRTRFIVAQKGDINLPVLSTLAVIFQCGVVSGHHNKDNYQYVVSGLSNVVKIYDYFDKYINQFLGIKKLSYLKFKALNSQLSNGSHLSPDKRPLLVKLSQEINSISRKSK
uniref:Orf336 protein n=1 Tax=Dunaliella salina TaxID=3046 RepID=A0A0C5C0N3_DUNSA|nr:LAGLIDADG endonuclease [Dunaliella salina]